MTQSTLRSENPVWQGRINNLPRLAQSDFPIIISGESGTGKDILAREIHRLSHRQQANFVSVNCAAIQESLVESELFGHRKGSFTGADSHRQGAFLAADKGTLFLDEIGDLSLTIQAKLLRALENREIKPVGSDQVVKIDVRIISATHKNLAQLVEAGLFRQDLFYRLNVIPILVPRLTDRPEDIPTLATLIGRDCSVKFSDQALEVLKDYSWPGNIRELKNFILRGSALYPSHQIGANEVFQLLQETVAPLPKSGLSNREFFRRVEREVVLERLAANNWNQRMTARELGIPKSTLNDQVRRLGIVTKPKPPVNESSQYDSDRHSLPGPDLGSH